MIYKRVTYTVCPIILGLILGWFTASIVSSFFIVTKPIPTPQTDNNKQEVPLPDIAENVINKNVFQLSISPVKVGVSSNIPQLDAKLLGLLNDNKTKKGFAIILFNNETIVLGLGKEKNGLKLVEIADSSVVVSKDSRLYNIVMEKEKIAAVATGGSSSRITTSGSNINVKLNRADIQSQLKDLNQVLQSALVSPYYNSGNFSGYRVARLKEDSPLKKLGLNVGDVITRVNGSDLKSPEPLFNMMSQINNISAVTVDLIRNSEKKTIFVEIK